MAIPECWKIRRDSPVHKGDVKTDRSNFRPILSIPMKIVHDQVSAFIKESEII